MEFHFEEDMTLSNATEEENDCIIKIRDSSTKFLKFGHHGNPKFREFILSEDLKSISWDSNKKAKTKTQILVSKITNIRFGQKTTKFKRAARSDLNNLSFSIFYGGNKSSMPEESLDLVACDKKDLKVWTTAINALRTKKINLPKSFNEEANDSNNTSNIAMHKTSTMKFSSHAGTIPRLSNKNDSSHFQQQSYKTMRLNAQTETNTVYSFGSNKYGQIVQPKSSVYSKPTISQSLLGNQVIQIAIGQAHSLFLVSPNLVYQCGHFLGTGLNETLFKPQLLNFGTSIKKDHYPSSIYKIVSVACGDYHSLALSENGKVWSQGANIFGQCGHGDDENNDSVKDVFEPKLIEYFQINDIYIKQIDCGSFTSAALEVNSGFVYTQGYGKSASLGHDQLGDEHTPRRISGLKDIQKISCGADHMLAAKELEIYSWGTNKHGQCAIDTENDSQYLHKSSQSNKQIPSFLVMKPTSFVIKKHHRIVTISSGFAHSAAILSYQNKTQLLYIWGLNSSNQLGLHSSQVSYSCKPLQIPFEGIVFDVKCGAHHTLILNDGGRLFSTGSNRSGQLGQSQLKTESTENKQLQKQRTHSKLSLSFSSTDNIARKQNSMNDLFSEDNCDKLGGIEDKLISNISSSPATVVNVQRRLLNNDLKLLFKEVDGLSGKDIQDIICGGDCSFAIVSYAWLDDMEVSKCMGFGNNNNCKGEFTVVNRRHHCRSCGGIFCSACSSHTYVILSVDIKPVRVCDKCYSVLKSKNDQ